MALARWKFIGLIVAAISCSTGCLWAGFAAADEATTVQVAAVVALDWKNAVQLTADIEPRQQAMLAAQRAGQVVAVLYQSGESVAAGSVLVQLNDAPERAQLAVDDAKQTETRDALARAQKLMTINGASRAALEQAEADAAEASAQASADGATLAQLRVVAPFAGTLGIRNIAVGDYVAQGQMVAQLTEAAPLRVLFSIPQTEAADVALGDRFSLNPPNSGAGRISALSPMVDAATNSRAAEGVLSRGGDGLVPGSFATISLMTGAAIPAFAVPATALNDSLLGRYVFVVHAQASGDVLRTVYVSQLASQGNNAVIAAADLKAGDEVVAIGGFKLTDGEAVKIAP